MYERENKPTAEIHTEPDPEMICSGCGRLSEDVVPLPFPCDLQLCENCFGDILVWAKVAGRMGWPHACINIPQSRELGKELPRFHDLE